MVALALFALHEARTDRPMLDLSLLRRPSVSASSLAALTSSAALFGTLILLPFYLTAVLGFGPVRLAFAIAPIAACFMVVSPYAGRVMLRVGSERLAVAGLLVAACGSLWAAVAATSQSYPRLLPGLLGLGVGLAMSTSPITTTAIHDVPPARLGVASALPNISRYTGGALGAAVLGVVLGHSVPAPLERLTSQADAAGRALVAEGFRSAMVVAAGFLVLAAAAALRMPRLDGREPAAAGPAGAQVAAPPSP